MDGILARRTSAAVIDTPATDGVEGLDALNKRIADCKHALIETLCAHGMYTDAKCASGYLSDLLADMNFKEIKELETAADEAAGHAAAAEARDLRRSSPVVI